MTKQLWLAAAAWVLMSPIAAWAHAKLVSTDPAAGAILAAAPKVLTLKFNEAVQLAALKLSAAGRDIPLKVDRGAAAAPQVAVPLPPLAEGQYQVQWSALTADDGHVVKGSFSFAVASPP
jgi:methionine-rich copper-binding protein CopC